MRYILRAKVRPERRADLLRALEDGSFGRGFPYGDLGEVLCEGRVDATGTIRWVEVCYCREYYGVAMHEELPYLEEYLTDIEVADARNPIQWPFTGVVAVPGIEVSARASPFANGRPLVLQAMDLGSSPLRAA